MRAAELEDVLYGTPFIPFDVHIDGKDHIHIVDIARISSLTLHRRKRKAA